MHTTTSASRAIGFATLAALALLGGSLTWLEPAAADGALAIGEPKDVAAEGYAYGFGLDLATAEAASAKALHDCTAASAGVDKRAQALCKVVQTFKSQCFAVAMDPKDATPGAGWAIAKDKDSASRNALARCQETAGADRREFCEVTHSGCDGDAK